MNNRFYPLENELYVIELKQENRSNIFNSYPMFKMGDLSKKVIAKILGVSNFEELQKPNHIDRLQWIDEGLDAEVLHMGATTWKKGKIRIKLTLEFCPDEAEIQQPASLLDDIRQEIK